MAFKRTIVHNPHASHAPPSYYQPGYRGETNNPNAKYAIAHANPEYFQPGYIGEKNLMMKGRKSGGKGRKSAKHGGKAGIHASPLPPFHDPWKHRGMGRIRGR
jgi:hypothetical protein